MGFKQFCLSRVKEKPAKKNIAVELKAFVMVK